MSNIGQAALVVTGTIVGSAFGNPQLGFLLGSLTGQALFPTKLPGAEGPRLQDLSIQSSALGATIPQVHGTFAIAGNVIWSSGLLETATTEEVGGKGGPKQEVTNYSYRASFAVGLCEGEMQGILRIWADAKLVYDVRPQQDGEVDADYNARLAASQAFASNFEFYSGSTTQTADPTIESYESVGNVPGYRGLCYVVFTDFQLADYGNRIPNLLIEVYTDGTPTTTSVTEYANDILYPWLDSDNPLNPYNQHACVVECTGRRYDRITTRFSTPEAALNAARESSGKSLGVYLGYSSGERGPGFNYGYTNRMGSVGVRLADVRSVYLHYNSFEPDKYVAASNVVALVPKESGYYVNVNGSFSGINFSSAMAAVYFRGAKGLPVVRDRRETNGSIVDYDYVPDPIVPWYIIYSLNARIRVYRIPSPPGNPCQGSELAGYPGFCLDADGNIISSGDYSRVTGTFKSLQKYGVTNRATLIGGGEGGDTYEVTSYPLNPVLRSDDPDYNNQTFWENAYATAVANGDMPEGLVYGVNYPDSQTYAYQRVYDQVTATTNEVTIGSIVNALCRRAGLTAAQIDTSALTKTVKGFVVSRVGAARTFIEALRAYGFFDCVESDGVLKFVPRGGAIAATLTDDDLSAHTRSGTRPPAVAVDRKQDVELPRKLRVHYAMPHRDYEPGEQYSARLTTSAVNIADVEVVAALSDDEAAQTAETLLFEAWAARNVYNFTLDHSWLGLEPTDCVQLPVDGNLERVRIVNIDDQLPGLRKVEAVRDDDGSYVSTATGSSTPGSTYGIILYGPTELVLLDIPALREEDDDAGYYAALRGTMSSSTWRGAALYRSIDSGASFQQIGAVTTATKMGTVLSALPSGPSEVWDNGNELLVQMKGGATLESRTEDAVLTGANAAAIGADGRWEIIQFTTATQDGDLWRLSGLLRGRRGTEHNIGTSEANDQFIFLSGGGLIRIPMPSSYIGLSQVLRAVTFGTSVEGDDEVSFTGAGMALKPFSPVHINAERLGSGNLYITWTRRGRLGGELADGADIALSEESESYDVEVYDLTTSPISLIVSSTVSVQSATLAIGSPEPGSYRINIYQRSAIVGRGVVGTIDITPVPSQDAQEITGTDGAPSDSAILLPFTYDELDVNGFLPAPTRSGDYPRICSRGFMGDGYEARLSWTTTGSPTLPASIASDTGDLAVKVAMRFYRRSGTTTRDSALYIGNDDAVTPLPKLELCIYGDHTLASTTYEGMSAVQMRTSGSTQVQRLCRSSWRYGFPAPDKTLTSISPIATSKPQGIAYTSDGRLLVTALYGTQSRCYALDYIDLTVDGSFTFTSSPTYTTVTDVSEDADGNVWFLSNDREALLQVDVAASLAAGACSITGVFSLANLTGPKAIAHITTQASPAQNYLLVAEYATAGTPYLYVIDPADVVLGGTFVLADRVKRLTLPVRVEGIAYKEGYLYLQSSTSPTGGLVRKIDLDTFLTSGSDGDAWGTYDTGVTFYPPTALCAGMGVDITGYLWSVTTGGAAVADDTAFIAAWCCDPDAEFGPAMENSYRFEYASGTLTIKINEQDFKTLSWTASAADLTMDTDAALCIGGLPQLTAGTNKSYFNGTLRNVVIQGSAFTYTDPDESYVYQPTGSIETYQFSITNPDAETGDTTGWTVESGAMAVRDASPSPYAGSWYFYGGSGVASSVSYQSFTLDDIGLTEAEVDGGECWVTLEWAASTFDSQSDTNSLGFVFLDGVGATISTEMSTAMAPIPTSSWQRRSYGVLIPANTRTIRVRMSMVRVDGSNADGYADDIRAIGYKKVTA